jgi:DNA sulfur modification protein DndC
MKYEESLFGDKKTTLEHSIQLTIESMLAYGPLYRHWAIAFSGGKDSSAACTLIVWLILTGQIPAPESLTVLYADTRLELTPLHMAAMTILSELEAMGVKVEIVLPKLDDRYFVYMFGRGVPAAKNMFRWCTPQLKVEPMELALADLRAQYGEKFLMLTGVRQGESAARDQRISLSCSKDGAECGQGWFQVSTPESIADTLAPLLHWRVCHVWDWLTFHAPRYGFSTQLVAEVYGGDEAEEVNARTGCVGCNLASKDVALDMVLRLPQWGYLAPLKRLRPLYQELMHAKYRLRKDGSQRNKGGKFPKNPMRMGPYTMEARRYGLSQVLAIQDEINTFALDNDRPTIDLINEQEHARILALIDANTWPDGWDGTEPRADLLIPHAVTGDLSQQLLIGD